jgi:hypothetical protein
MSTRMQRRQRERRNEAAERQSVYDGLMLKQRVERMKTRPGLSRREEKRLIG